MLSAFCLLTVVTVFCAWFAAMARHGIVQASINHFWYFSLLWIVFFPLRAYLIAEGRIDLQIDRSWHDEQLLTSLGIAFCFWISVFLGYLSISYSSIELDLMPGNTRLPGHAAVTVLVFIGMAWFFIFSTVFSEGKFPPFAGNEQNVARIGRGPFFMLQTLYLDAFIAYAAGVYLHRVPVRGQCLSKWIVLATVVTSLIMTVAITSRRVIATVIFLLLVVHLLRARRGQILALCLVSSTILAAPLLDAFRYMDPFAWDGDWVTFSTALRKAIDARVFWTSVSSSFEGVDHLAAFVETAGVQGLITGVDGGVAWIYNSFLGLVPRTLWETKPYLYGSSAQQYFLYPWMYASGPAVTTLPVSFVVDFTFGLGLFVGLLMAFVLGRFFKVLSITLWSESDNVISRVIPLFVLVNVFNVIRSGTGFLQPLIIFIIVAALVVGLGPMLAEVRRLVRLVFLPNSLRHRM